MYKFAHRFDDDIIFYFDTYGNKYVASGGNLAWRINNPGLVPNHGNFYHVNGSIGSCGNYAIFSSPQEGSQALMAWLRLKNHYNSSLKIIAKHYQPHSTDAFINKISASAKISPDSKIKSLNIEEFNRLLISIEKFCGYISIGNETFTLLPKITAKINGVNEEDSYLINDNTVLSKDEAIKWILEQRLDAIIVHEKNGTVYLRSRPGYCIHTMISVSETVLPPSIGDIDTLVRIVGKEKQGQCLWAFINGISNTKTEALKSAKMISNASGGDAVFSLPNDAFLLGPRGFFKCIILKFGIDTAIVNLAVNFFRYLIKKPEQNSSHPPIIVFARSQGAIISEHALELLEPYERKKIRIFTFGGGSFIRSGKCHPDSHNYASAIDLVCIFASPKLRLLALQLYLGKHEGLTQEKIIYQLASQDAMFNLDSTDPKTIESYIKQRIDYYEKEIYQINNLTILDPDTKYQHKFKSTCYQKTIKSIIKKYQNPEDTYSELRK